MKCPNCHKKIENDSFFCPFCGKKIELDIECPKCGTKNSSNSLFCKKCGTELKTIEGYSEGEVEKTKTNNINWILSIISMSTMMLSILLILGLSFSPMLFSSFFSSNDYTIIAWATTILKVGIDKLFESNRYIDFANSIISLALLGAIVIVSIVVAAINVPKFIKSIKTKKYFNFSKQIVELFVLFAATYVYFSKFVVTQSPNYYDGIGKGALTVFIVVPIFLSFNMFVKEYLKEKHDLTKTIISSISRLVIFILAFVVLTNLGGLKIHIVATIKTGQSTVSNIYGRYGNAEYFTFLLENIQYIYPVADKYLNPASIDAGVALASELIVLILGARLLSISFKENSQKRPNYLFGAIISGIMLAGPILSIIFNSLLVSKLNLINNVQDYGAAFNASVINTNVCVYSIVLISILTINCIVCLFIDRKEKIENEEVK